MDGSSAGNRKQRIIHRVCDTCTYIDKTFVRFRFVSLSHKLYSELSPLLLDLFLNGFFFSLINRIFKLKCLLCMCVRVVVECLDAGGRGEWGRWRWRCAEKQILEKEIHCSDAIHFAKNKGKK